MPVTLKDIAAMAGVSVGTVDRALNNRGRIKPEVAARIRAIAEQMDYRANSVAKSLALRNKNLKIAVILHIQRNDFYDDVLLGIKRAQHEILDFGIQVSIYPGKNFDPAEQCRLIDLAVEEGATAIVIAPIDDASVIGKLSALHEQQFPVVFVSSLLADCPCFSSVHCDYHRSGRIGARLIDTLSVGGAPFLVVSPPLNMYGHQQRLKGIEAYVNASQNSLQIVDTIVVSSDSVDTYLYVSSALQKYPDVHHVLFCGNTKAFVRALDDCDYPITSVVYDNNPSTYEALRDGRISAAILQEPTTQGYEAIMLLFHYFTKKAVPEKDILIENKIILKECID